MKNEFFSVKQTACITDCYGLFVLCACIMQG